VALGRDFLAAPSVQPMLSNNSAHYAGFLMAPSSSPRHRRALSRKWSFTVSVPICTPASSCFSRRCAPESSRCAGSAVALHQAPSRSLTLPHATPVGVPVGLGVRVGVGVFVGVRVGVKMRVGVLVGVRGRFGVRVHAAQLRAQPGFEGQCLRGYGERRCWRSRCRLARSGRHE